MLRCASGKTAPGKGTSIVRHNWVKRGSVFGVGASKQYQEEEREGKVNGGTLSLSVSIPPPGTPIILSPAVAGLPLGFACADH
jgi:hypothetical protein